jgi:hypothetical protein
MDLFAIVGGIGLSAAVLGIHFLDKDRVLIAVVVLGLADTIMPIIQFHVFTTLKINAVPVLTEYLGIYLIFSVGLFVGLSDLLMLYAGHLTKWRGETWVKELDYLYLAMAAIGVLIAIGKLDLAAVNFTLPDHYALLLLCFALVIRTIKTRADINNWAKRAPNRTFVQRASDWED